VIKPKSEGSSFIDGDFKGIDNKEHVTVVTNPEPLNDLEHDNHEDDARPIEDKKLLQTKKHHKKKSDDEIEHESG